MHQLPDDVVILISDFIGPQSGLCFSHVSAGLWSLLRGRHLYGLSERIPPLVYSKVYSLPCIPLYPCIPVFSPSVSSDLYTVFSSICLCSMFDLFHL